MLGTTTVLVQESLHAKIDKVYQDTSSWNNRLEKSLKEANKRYAMRSSGATVSAVRPAL